MDRFCRNGGLGERRLRNTALQRALIGGLDLLARRRRTGGCHGAKGRGLLRFRPPPVAGGRGAGVSACAGPWGAAFTRRSRWVSCEGSDWAAADGAGNSAAIDDFTFPIKPCVASDVNKANRTATAAAATTAARMRDDIENRRLAGAVSWYSLGSGSPL